MLLNIYGRSAQRDDELGVGRQMPFTAKEPLVLEEHQRCRGGPLVVLHHEKNRKLPDGSHVHGLVHRYMNPVAFGSQSTISGKKTISTSPRNMNTSSQMSQNTVSSIFAPLSRQLTMRLTAMGGVNWPRATL